MSTGSERPAFCGTTAIAGVGATTFTRASGRSVLGLAAEACAAALHDAGLPADQVDGILSYGLGGDSVSTQAVATALGVPELQYALDLDLGGQAPCLLVAQAAMAVASGVARHVLVFRALNGRSGVRVGRHRTSGPTTQFRYPVGLTSWPQYQALWARRYLAETGGSSESLGAVAVAQRAYAGRNDRAVVRRPLTMEDYLAAPYVAEPFRVPDCTTEVDGGCALLVTALDRARDLRCPPAVIAAGAYVAGPRAGLDIGDVFGWADYSRNFTHLLAPRLWAQADLGPADVEVAEIYDCFTSTVLMGLEGLGGRPRRGRRFRRRRRDRRRRQATRQHRRRPALRGLSPRDEHHGRGNRTSTWHRRRPPGPAPRRRGHHLRGAGRRLGPCPHPGGIMTHHPGALLRSAAAPAAGNASMLALEGTS
ncbi:MAG: thiolase C-terminal domain-containing protein [Streptosporangiaceae bacterium]